jgi:hypothetical protein
VTIAEIGQEKTAKSLPAERCLEKIRILLANSTDQNQHGKICSHHYTDLGKNRMLVLLNSTIMRLMVSAYRLIVISPTVSISF